MAKSPLIRRFSCISASSSSSSFRFAIFESPAYYLQQNDIVYVEPNKVRAGQSTINENNIKSVSLWVSVGSFLTSLAVLIVNILN